MKVYAWRVYYTSDYIFSPTAPTQSFRVLESPEETSIWSRRGRQLFGVLRNFKKARIFELTAKEIK